ncbi:mercuric transporter MerT family protein [Sphingomonas sp. Leaf33]|uniref:mercuric transporter MerT family protein n=1 Tax=Sphingomonas sp. Leaf33 TaxID=1736215 RepID=UPI000A48C32E|nr:mercuric transporter MerT family protein [Sphingomonas sp. Leaf33]
MIQPTTPSDRRAGWLAAGGIAGALLASSCCVLPLALVLLGVSGAWIGQLTALEPYTPVFAVLTLGLIAGGLWHAYRQPIECADGTCADPRRRTATRIALWVGAALVVVALTTRWWAPLFY